MRHHSPGGEWIWWNLPKKNPGCCIKSKNVYRNPPTSRLLQMLYKKRWQIYCCLKLSSKVSEENLSTFLRAAFCKELPSKGGAKVVRIFCLAMFLETFFSNLWNGANSSRYFMLSIAFQWTCLPSKAAANVLWLFWFPTKNSRKKSIFFFEQNLSVFNKLIYRLFTRPIVETS